MTIAPLAVLGIAKTAFSLIGSLVDAAKRPTPEIQTDQLKARETLWHQLGQSADVRSMTAEDLSKAAWTLYDQGLIGAQDLATLQDTSQMLTTVDSQGRVDWVAEFQARLSQHQSRGDEFAVAQDQRAMDIFSRLQAGARGMTSIRV